MVNRRLLLVVAGVLLTAPWALADDKKEDAVKQELKKLQGRWQAVSLERNGEKAPERMVAEARFEIKDNKMIERGRKDITELVIDPTQTPKTLDLTHEVTLTTRGKDGKIEQRREKETVKAIYTLEDDKLTICLAPQPKAERPTKIESGKEVVLAVFKRQKP